MNTENIPYDSSNGNVEVRRPLTDKTGILLWSANSRLSQYLSMSVSKDCVQLFKQKQAVWQWRGRRALTPCPS